MASVPAKPNLAQSLKDYEQYWKSSVQFQRSQFSPGKEGGMQTFSNVLLNGEHLSEISFESCVFDQCTFEDVHFMGCSFFGSDLQRCTFLNCTISFTSFFDISITDSVFQECSFSEGVFSDAFFEQVKFIRCREIIEIRFGGCSFDQLSFWDCRLQHLTFENTVPPADCTIQFTGCEIGHCTYYWLDLEKITFEECSISFSNFVNCHIHPHSLATGNELPEGEFNSMDFQTILKSTIPSIILGSLFGIHNADLKQYIFEMATKIELHTVFISYSFHDQQFAHRLNEALKKRGAMTFLWQMDAPAGKRLKKIMTYNVNKFDKVLFIASEHSLKSEACHFELTNGRTKQDKNWELVLFPIHIDPFLFSVDENDIPRKNRAEFWTNILELREINSMDFSAFADEKYDAGAFNQLVDKLIKGLQKER